MSDSNTATKKRKTEQVDLTKNWGSEEDIKQAKEMENDKDLEERSFTIVLPHVPTMAEKFEFQQCIAKVAAMIFKKSVVASSSLGKYCLMEKKNDSNSSSSSSSESSKQRCDECAEKVRIFFYKKRMCQTFTRH